jgi:hypothetical protein
LPEAENRQQQKQADDANRRPKRRPETFENDDKSRPSDLSVQFGPECTGRRGASIVRLSRRPFHIFKDTTRLQRNNRLRDVDGCPIGRRYKILFLNGNQSLPSHGGMDSVFNIAA